MKFEDLPPFSEIINTRNELYCGESKFDREICMYHPAVHIYTSHASIHDAWKYLKSRPETEVSDAFFGNNFPFLAGNSTRENSVSSHPITAVIIRDLHIFKNFEKLPEHVKRNSCDFHLLPYSNMGDKFKKFIENKEVFISVYKTYPLRNKGYYYFATKTYDELVQRIGLMEMMEL